MARGKHAKLQEKSARLRKETRQSVAIHARWSLGGRPEEDVLVTDLGTTGCRVRSNAVGVSRSESLVLHLGEAGAVSGQLKWTKGGALGVSFDAPLDEVVVERLSRQAMQSAPERPRQRAPIMSPALASKAVH